MVRTAALSLLLITSPVAAQDERADFRETPASEMVWTYVSLNNSLYYTLPREVSGAAFGGRIAWVHGSHSGDRTVAYRTSLARMHFDCRGNSAVSAFTSYMADGRGRDNYDWSLEWTAIRPGSFEASLEGAVCWLVR